MVLAVAAVSLAFETAQLFISSRFASIDDLIFNTLGGALGVWLGFCLSRRLAAWWPAR
jgi:glycopeptide antibiotics resistance protein